MDQNLETTQSAPSIQQLGMSVSWGESFQFWVALFWRVSLAMIATAVVLTIVVYTVIFFLIHPANVSELGIISKPIVNLLLVPFIFFWQIYYVRRLLNKDFRGFSISLVRK
jgi:hypothetical protein